jgi:hypothetical protein
MQSGDGGIVDTGSGAGNQQAVDGSNQRARWPAYMRSTGLLWKEPGYKVAWVERVCHYLRKNIASLGFRASRCRVELATCEF